jgi:gamma-glutamyltranspeptidase/glutathione hydrolase
MKQFFCWVLIIFVGFLAAPATAAARLSHGIVATVDPLATEAGLNVLKNGGNAIDATVAVAFTLGVVDGENSGIGGGCFMLVRRANGELVAIDGRETAPGAATHDMFVRNGAARTELSQTGALASGVPGALAAYAFAVNHYGRKQLKELLLPAAEIAEKGFRVEAAYAACLKSVEPELARFASSRKVFFRNGRLVAKGELLKQPDLALTYRKIAERGIDWFYRGTFAEATEKWMKENGGLMAAQDFRSYKVKIREPIISKYRDYELVGFPPPSSGGIHVAQILNILENFDLKSLEEAARLHFVAEAMKLAFADRAYWLGDADFVSVPRGLADKSYAQALAKSIRTDRATEVQSHGTPPNWQTDIFKKHTTHFSVADAEGNWVACTATVNTSFGSKVVIPGTGVIMNDQMDDFSIQPGVTNAFGLLGGEANAVAPGKRPLSSMSPTIVLKDGKPIIAMGAAGGPKIISQVVVELMGMLDLQMSPQMALNQPRIHHQWFPNHLMVERSLSPEIQRKLRESGHVVEISSDMGVSQIVALTPTGDSFTGAADPRAGGSAKGF